MSISSLCMSIYKNPIIKKIRRAIVRFMIYGGIMIAGEVSFYTLSKVGKDLPWFINWFFKYNWRIDDTLNLNHMWDIPIRTLFGQASLYMFFVYASIFVFGLEPMYKHIKHWNWLIRGLIYMTIILSMECITGWVLYWTTGYSIWYYDDGALTIFTYTSWAIAPMWFTLGLISERVIDIIYRLTEMKSILKENNIASRRDPLSR